MTTDEFGNGTVLTDIHDGIGLITLNRPEVRNALSSDVLEALPTAIRSLEASSDVDVLVLTGRRPGVLCRSGFKGVGRFRRKYRPRFTVRAKTTFS